jgi:hypothetical protein
MRTMIGLTALLLVITTPTLGAGLYRCQEKDAVSLKDDGTLGRDKRWPSMRKRYENITVDTATGNYPGGGSASAGAQALIVLSTVPKLLAPVSRRAVATTVRTAASPFADHIAR